MADADALGEPEFDPAHPARSSASAATPAIPAAVIPRVREIDTCEDPSLQETRRQGGIAGIVEKPIRRVLL
ncbi:hypothetical protein GCM10009776_02900 [Microbacterium deminutum]|uniref:Uncharacterized protein n=1 Tax=Microbacterium deminutum TaxID=344164 RepID=A0ABN2Q4T6_9MICO